MTRNVECSFCGNIIYQTDKVRSLGVGEDGLHRVAHDSHYASPALPEYELAPGLEIEREFVPSARDYFAAQALSGYLANERFCDQLLAAIHEQGWQAEQRTKFHSMISRRAFLLADAMLAEREKGGKAEETRRDPNRCEVCDWPLAATKDTGCRPGDCRYRPAEGSPEWHRIKARRAELAEKAKEEERPGAWTPSAVRVRERHLAQIDAAIAQVDDTLSERGEGWHDAPYHLGKREALHELRARLFPEHGPVAQPDAKAEAVAHIHRVLDVDPRDTGLSPAGDATPAPEAIVVPMRGLAVGDAFKGAALARALNNCADVYGAHIGSELANACRAAARIVTDAAPSSLSHGETTRAQVFESLKIVERFLERGLTTDAVTKGEFGNALGALRVGRKFLERASEPVDVAALPSRFACVSEALSELKRTGVTRIDDAVTDAAHVVREMCAKALRDAGPREPVEVVKLRDDDTELAWLVEAVGPQYWTGQTGCHKWSPNSLDAVRFARKKDAEAVIAWVLPNVEPRPLAIEHGWHSRAAEDKAASTASAIDSTLQADAERTAERTERSDPLGRLGESGSARAEGGAANG